MSTTHHLLNERLLIGIHRYVLYDYRWSNGVTLTSESFLVDGATVNLEDQDGRTLLHWAALGGHAPICLSLIEQGLAVDSKDYLG